MQSIIHSNAEISLYGFKSFRISHLQFAAGGRKKNLEFVSLCGNFQAGKDCRSPRLFVLIQSILLSFKTVPLVWKSRRDSTAIGHLVRDFSDIQADTLEEKELGNMSYWMSEEKERDLGQP